MGTEFASCGSESLLAPNAGNLLRKQLQNISLFRRADQRPGPLRIGESYSDFTRPSLFSLETLALYLGWSPLPKSDEISFLGGLESSTVWVGDKELDTGQKGLDFSPIDLRERERDSSP